MAGLFSLEVLPAKEGDCLLLHWGGGKSVGLIDGGPARVYEDTLRPRLMALRQHFNVATLPLAFVMVSHVDNDHIIGVKKLFAELRNALSKNLPLDAWKLRVERLWHNAFTDILGDSFDAYYARATEASLAASTQAAEPNDVEAALAAAGLGGVAGGLELALVLAGHGEGRTLRDDHGKLYAADQIQRLNAPFAKAGQSVPIMRREPSAVTRVEGLQILVVGPSEKELVRLKTDFDLYLRKKGLAAPAALLAALRKDNSPTNLSSIVCLVEYDGKSILLTGDALGDKIVTGLTEAGRLQNGRLKVDILKLPHHGSARNAGRAFFEAIHADSYIVSANGRHENPDRLTLEWLIDSRRPGDDYRLIFTYPLSEIDATRAAIRRGKGESWNPETDAIATLLAGYKAAGHAFTWTEGRAVVDLGDVEMAW
jgi:hypothetical protein